MTAYQAKDGTWSLYIIDGCYRSQSLNGPWTRGKLEFDTRGRNGVDMSNCTFVRRSPRSIPTPSARRSSACPPTTH